MQTIATNKRANYNYLIKEKFEAGLVLTGAEVKSLRVNTGSINESYIIEKGGELWLTNSYIKKYSSSIEKENNPTREKKILVNKKELNIIIGSSKKEGMSVIPLFLYLLMVFVDNVKYVKMYHIYDYNSLKVIQQLVYPLLIDMYFLVLDYDLKMGYKKQEHLKLKMD